MSKKKYDPPEDYEWLKPEENVSIAVWIVVCLVAWAVFFGKACVG